MCFVKDDFILRHIVGALHEAPAGGPFVNDFNNKSALTPSKDGEQVRSCAFHSVTVVLSWIWERLVLMRKAEVIAFSAITVGALHEAPLRENETRSLPSKAIGFLTSAAAH